MTHKRSTRDKSILEWTLPIDITSQLIEKIQSLAPTIKSEYLKAEFLSKFVSADTAPALTRRNNALSKWLATEAENESTEERLLLTPQDYQILPGVSYSVFVAWCRATILDILGDEIPPIDALIGAFSGGASTSRSRTRSFPASKYIGEAHVTHRALDVFLELVPSIPLWLNARNAPLIRVVPGNVFFTVPKKSDIDRVACKEPDINMFLQKGIGSYLRSCLRRIGINLNDQSINRSLARVGSRDGNLATLDLSSASDSVTRELVFQLLPEFWFTLLDAVRSPVTIIDGVERRNTMFSSMGNGFTFELESLIFYVLSRAVAFFTGTRGVISVYGDDIICPVGIVDKLTFVLGWFGFQVNPDKSFWSGPIRESCGGHYYNGFDITPFYIKEPITTLPDLIHVANQLRNWARFDGVGIITGFLDPEVEPIWLWLKGLIPRCLWGGADTSFKYQLASPDAPKSRIQEDLDRKKTGMGGYLHWHNIAWDRESCGDGVQTSVRTVSTNRFRLRTARPSAVSRLPALFSSEIGLTSDSVG